MIKSKNLCVIGLGYIGLPTAVVFAKNNWQVTGVDINQQVVDSLKHGKVPFVEDGLEAELNNVLQQKKLNVSTSIPSAEVYIIAVPTPFKENHAADLRYVESAIDTLTPVLKGGELVVIESTCPTGTTAAMAKRLFAQRPELENGEQEVYFAHSPERVLPGRIMAELIDNDRVVGGYTPQATQLAVSVYESFCKGKVHATNAETAELAKLTENSFRDVNIAFANELSLICDRININVWELIKLANKHPRVNILQPGPGVGGHCIAVDPWFIVSADPAQAKIIRTAREVNDSKPQWVVEKLAVLLENCDPQISKPTIATLGLAFKPNIDDLRESPALEICAAIAKRYPQLTQKVVEPHINALPPKLSSFQNLELTDAKSAIAEAQVVLLIVNHQAFESLPDPRQAGKLLLDTRGMWTSKTN